MWKEEYNERRRDKYESDPDYRKKRLEQAGDREERKAYMKEYAKKNPEKFRRTPEQQAEYNRRRRERYAKDKAYRDSLKKASSEYQRNNPGKRLATTLRRYGITVDYYNSMLAKQGGGCALCGCKDSGCSKKDRLHVDHCHTTGKVRGLLCTNCNQGLGKFKDNPDRLRKAAEYLEDAMKSKEQGELL